MRMSKIFSQTLRDNPAEAEVDSHRLLLRAGFIRQLASGVFTLMPLGLKAVAHISSILRQEIEAIGGQEISMPVVQPADLWQESGRWYAIDAELGRLKDRAGHELVLGMTHEEVIADLARKEIRSYRQLPLLLYHIQTKWRDDPRPRAGLIRTREFLMKDSYSLDTDWDGLDRQYQAHYQAYFNIFRRCGLQVIAVSGDVGMMGGKLAHEFMFLTPIGEDSLLICQQCGYSANRQVAVFRKQALPAEAALPLEKVATPDCKTIESLANFLHIPASHTAKAVFMIASVLTQAGKADERFIFAITRGDMEINETKLANAVNARSLRPATEKEIKAVGAEPGYASPVGLQNQSDSKPIVVADELIPQSANLVSGANEAGFHLLNVNIRRDYTADIVQDITAARDGDGCPQCGHPLQLVRGVEVGNIFKLGARFSDDMGCTFQDKDGQEKPVIMGSYGIGLGRLLACVAEAHHDEKGLIWPVTVSPFQVHLVVLMGRPDAGETSASANQPAEMAESLYQLLRSQGIDVLYDDRIETPGVKFNDADLIGNPLRLTVSERSLKQGGVEAKRRDRTDKVIVPIDQVLEWVKHEIAELNSEIMAAVKTEIGKFD